MKGGGPWDAAVTAVYFGTWQSILPPLQKVKFESGSIGRRETDDPLPFRMLLQLSMLLACSCVFWGEIWPKLSHQGCAGMLLLRGPKWELLWPVQ